MFIFLIIGLLLGALVIIFAVQNIATVAVVFLTWRFEGSLALIVVLAIATGMVISWLLSLSQTMKRNAVISALTRENEMLKGEVVNKKVEVETEKSKLAATNAYIDDIEKNPIHG